MRDQEQNIEHADHPRAGDFWHEMFCPMYRVLKVDDDRVLVQYIAACAGKEISDTDPKPRVMSRRSFAQRVRYKTMLDKTWCDVVPRILSPKADNTS